MPYSDPGRKAEYMQGYNRRYRRANHERYRDASKKYRAKAPGGLRSGKPWTDDEIRRLHDPDRPDDITLAKRLGRSVTAIQVKRAKTKPL
jgi:hypothetical protein